ncbi:MAG: ribosome maturation factor RimP [Candidatus Krumholzibacteriia bacterium]|nr:ribosome maturation factor RimP [bacterium]MCB9513250.1 ribosome maturation factor RimP [Candidatus Latescibacterota bacterium]MCB9514714.1 ribosome maturation factor RimP [Candidatus Latescibacterota bacterium]
MREDLESLLTEEIRQEGLELYSWQLRPAGKRRLLQVFIHGEQGVNLDDCARVSRRVGAALEAAEAVEGSYVLEVSSPGVDRPLLTPRHFAMALGERVRITRADHDPASGENPTLEGRLSDVGDDAIRLEWEGGEVTLPWSAIGKARVLATLSTRRD